MNIRYYQARTPDRRIIRGGLDNWLDFAYYNEENGEWDDALNAFYADEILVSSTPSYQEISKERALDLIAQKERAHEYA